jgi:hypothetical protein
MSNWFVAKLVFRVITGNGNHTPQFDEQLRLINADNAQEAFFKARYLGANEQTEFATEDLNEVSWQFVDVAELTPILAFQDGLELHSRIHEADSATSYISFVHHRAKTIMQQHQYEPQAEPAK